MKGFHKLALAAAIAAVPAAGIAMQPLEDAELSGVVGQDGISLEITADVDVDLGWEDTSGVPGTLDPAGLVTATERGMVYMPGFNINGNINIDIDAGSTVGTVGGGVLQVAISLPAISVNNFEIYVSGSGNTGADYVAGNGADGNGLNRFNDVAARVADPTPLIDPVLSLGSITIADMDITLQLGEDANQFALIDTGGVAIDIDVANLVVVDAGNAGSLHVASLALSVDPSGTTIGVDDAAGGGAPGLVINMAQNDQQISMMNVGFGDGATQANGIGNLYTNVSPNANTQIVVRGR